MIEILKKGTKKQVTCKNCGAVLSYEREDVEYPKQQYAMGYGDYYRFPIFSGTIKCPQCEHKIDV